MAERALRAIRAEAAARDVLDEVDARAPRTRRQRDALALRLAR